MKITSAGLVVMRLATGPLALLVYWYIMRGMAIANPSDAGPFALGLLLGPLLWFAVKETIKQAHALVRARW